MIHLQINNIIEGLSGGNLVFKTEKNIKEGNFYHLRAAKIEGDLIKDRATVLGKVNDFFKENREGITESSIDQLKSCLENRMKVIDSTLYGFLGILRWIFNRNVALMQEKQSIIDLNEVIKCGISLAPSLKKEPEETKEEEEKQAIDNSNVLFTPNRQRPPISSFRSPHTPAVPITTALLLTPSKTPYKAIESADLGPPQAPPLLEGSTFSGEPRSGEKGSLSFNPNISREWDKETLQRQITEIGEYLNIMRNTLTDIKSLIEEYDALKRTIDGIKSDLKEIQKDKKRFEILLNQLKKGEEEQEVVYLKYGSEIVPFIPKTRLDEIKKRNEEINTTNSTRKQELEKMISELKERKNETELKENEPNDEQAELKKLSKELDTLIATPPFDMKRLKPGFTIGNCKEKIKYWVNKYAPEGENDIERQRLKKELIESEERIEKIEQITSNAIPFEEYKNFVKIKEEEMNKWELAQQKRILILHKKPTPAKPLEPELIGEFFELKSLIKLSEGFSVLIGTNVGDEETSLHKKLYFDPSIKDKLYLDASRNARMQ